MRVSFVLPLIACKVVAVLVAAPQSPSAMPAVSPGHVAKIQELSGGLVEKVHRRSRRYRYYAYDRRFYQPYYYRPYQSFHRPYYSSPFYGPPFRPYFFYRKPRFGISF